MFPSRCKSIAMWLWTTSSVVALSAVALWFWGRPSLYAPMDSHRAAQLRGGDILGCAGPCTEHFNPPNNPSCEFCEVIGNASTKCTSFGTYFQCRPFVGTFCQECCTGPPQNCSGEGQFFNNATCTPPAALTVNNCVGRIKDDSAVAMMCLDDCSQ